MLPLFSSPNRKSRNSQKSLFASLFSSKHLHHLYTRLFISSTRYTIAVMAGKENHRLNTGAHSSLMAFLRNPLAWHKRYVEKIYDTPRTPASIVGSAGHLALENFYRATPWLQRKRVADTRNKSRFKKVLSIYARFLILILILGRRKSVKRKKKNGCDGKRISAGDFVLS